MAGLCQQFRTPIPIHGLNARTLRPGPNAPTTTNLIIMLAPLLAFILSIPALPVVFDEPPQAPASNPAPAPAPGAAPAPPSPMDSIDKARLMAIVAEIPSQRSPVGEAHIKGLLATETLLEAKVKALGFTPLWQPIPYRPRAQRDNPDFPKFRNLIFEIQGATLPNEIILVGAHIDAVPTTPGADDNASGIAGLLEMARALGTTKHARTIRFVLFNLEEIGLVGSTHYAQTVADDNHNIVLMVSLEMLGFYSAAQGSQRNPFPAFKELGVPDTADFIGLGTILKYRPQVRALETAMRAAEPRCKVFTIDHSPIAPPDLLRSDHAPFLLRGMPGIIATDTANFRSPHYHKPTDTAETLDAERFYLTVRALTGGISALARPIDRSGQAAAPDPLAPPTPTPTPALTSAPAPEDK